MATLVLDWALQGGVELELDSPLSVRERGRRSMIHLVFEIEESELKTCSGIRKYNGTIAICVNYWRIKKITVR